MTIFNVLLKIQLTKFLLIVRGLPSYMTSCFHETGASVGLRSLNTTGVTCRNDPALSPSSETSPTAFPGSRALEAARSADSIRHEWGSVAQDPSLVHVRREPWEDTTIYPFSAKAFYVGVSSCLTRALGILRLDSLFVVYTHSQEL